MRWARSLEQQNSVGDRIGRCGDGSACIRFQHMPRSRQAVSRGTLMQRLSSGSECRKLVAPVHDHRAPLCEATTQPHVKDHAELRLRYTEELADRARRTTPRSALCQPL